MKKIALITGATAGIGEATALLLAQNNFNLILTGRRNERLKQLKVNISKVSQSEVLLLNFDIRSQKDTETALNSIPDNWKNIEELI